MDEYSTVSNHFIAFLSQNNILNDQSLLRKSPFNTPFTRSINYLDRDLDSNVDCNLDSNPEDVSIYTGNSLFNTQSASHCCLLFSHSYMSIHLISGFKLSRS